MPIRRFTNPEVEAFFYTGALPKADWREIADVMARRIDYIAAAYRFGDLGCLPSGTLVDHPEGGHCVCFDNGWRARLTWIGMP